MAQLTFNVSQLFIDKAIQQYCPDILTDINHVPIIPGNYLFYSIQSDWKTILKPESIHSMSIPFIPFDGLRYSDHMNHSF